MRAYEALYYALKERTDAHRARCQRSMRAAMQRKHGRKHRHHDNVVQLRPEAESTAIVPASADLTTWTSPTGALLRQLATAEGEPVFVAKDVCDALGIANSRDAVSRLDDDEKGRVVNSDAPSKGGNPYLVTVTEPGLYKLMARSSKPEAKAFDRWVRHEVLPSIRKTGGYAPTTALAAPNAELAQLIDAMQVAHASIQALITSQQQTREVTDVLVGSRLVCIHSARARIRPALRRSSFARLAQTFR